MHRFYILVPYNRYCTASKTGATFELCATGGASHILRRKSQVKGARIVTSLEQIVLIELRIQPDCDYEQTVVRLEALSQRSNYHHWSVKI